MRTIDSMKGEASISVFEFQDYRAFLKAWFEATKKAKSHFSHRAFAQKAGFSSSNFLMLVMQGQRNLTEDSLARLLTGLNLNKQEQEFFRNLVFFNQAKNHQDKNYYYQRLLQSKKFSQLQPIQRQQYEYYSTWYHPAIRELIVSADFDGTPEWLARRLNPAITPAQAARSIELLESLGFIKKVGEAKWEQTSPLVSTGPELSSLVVHNYHKTLLDLTKEIMDNLPTSVRDVSTLTLGVKKERLGEIREKIREFRKDILKMVANDTQPEEVAQLNIQFFPLTHGTPKPIQEDKK